MPSPTFFKIENYQSSCEAAIKKPTLNLLKELKIMTSKSKVQTITNLATSLASKASDVGSAESSAELLQALNSVAKQLEANSGSNNDIKMLAKQVQELVKTKTSA